MSSQWLAIVGALALAVFIGELLRRGILREKFAVLWLGVASVTVVLAIFPSLLTWIADLLGFQVPANLLFLISLALLLAVSVQLSFEVSKLDRQLGRVAQEQALLSARVEQLESGRDPQ